MAKMVSSAGKLKNTTFMFVLPIAIAVLAGGYLYARLNPPMPDIRKFSGVGTGVVDGKIVMTGVYFPQTRLPSALQTQRELSFRVTDATVFEKIIMKLPDEREVMENGGRFNLQDLATTTAPGSLSELASVLKNGQYPMEARFAVQLVGAQDPVATHVTYRLISYSERLAPPPLKKK
jgi:hypothetical protein